jgi:hypothetical protein
MRPQRLYKTDDGRYYFIIDGKRKYIRIPKNITEAELVKLNTKTILKLFGKRIRPRKKRKLIPKLERPIINGPLGQQLSISGVSNQPTASTRFVQQEKPIMQISELITQAKVSDDAKKGFNKLIELAGKSVGELFKGSQIIQSQKNITKPTSADTTTDEIDFGKKTTKITDDDETIDEIVRGNIGDPSSLLDSFNSQKEKVTKTFQKGLYVVLNTIGFLNEDEKKKYFQKYRNDEDLKNMYAETYDNIMSLSSTTASETASETASGTSSEPGTEETISSDDKPIVFKKKPKGESKEAPPLENVPQRPVYTKPSRGQMQDYLKKGASGLMPSLKDKPLTTAEKIATTPSFSASTTGTEQPASPMPVSIYEQAKADYYANLSPEEKAKEEAKLQMGFGNENEGLFNDQIAKIIRKRVGKIIPVIPSDKVNELLGYVRKGDKKFAAVINTNPSTSDGSGNDGYRPGHWRAIFINNEDDFPSVEYFDPLAEGPAEKPLVAVLRKICKKMNPEKLFLYKQSNIRRQAKFASTCGWHSLQFIDDRWNGEPWSQATGYDNYMEKLENPADDSHDGEKEVSKYIKKYNVYL